MKLCCLNCLYHVDEKTDFKEKYTYCIYKDRDKFIDDFCLNFKSDKDRKYYCPKCGRKTKIKLYTDFAKYIDEKDRDKITTEYLCQKVFEYYKNSKFFDVMRYFDKEKRNVLIYFLACDNCNGYIYDKNIQKLNQKILCEEIGPGYSLLTPEESNVVDNFILNREDILNEYFDKHSKEL